MRFIVGFGIIYLGDVWLYINHMPTFLSKETLPKVATFFLFLFVADVMELIFKRGK